MPVRTVKTTKRFDSSGNLVEKFVETVETYSPEEVANQPTQPDAEPDVEPEDVRKKSGDSDPSALLQTALDEFFDLLSRNKRTNWM